MKKVFKYGKSSKLKKCREMIDDREKNPPSAREEKQ